MSNLGDGIVLVAYPWLASLLTRDAVLVAGVSVAAPLPWLVVSLPVGAIIDRNDRRRLMAGSDAARALLLGGLGFAVATDMAGLPLLYVLALLVGTAEVIKDNSAQTILPRIVPAGELERANRTLWVVEGAGNTAIGPWLGGMLLGVTTALAFGVAAGAYFLSAASVLTIAGSYGPRSMIPSNDRRSMRRDIGEGLSWLWRHRLLRTLGVYVGLINLSEGMILATAVLFVQEILGLDAAAYGQLLLNAALGGLVGAWLGPIVSRRIGPGPSLLVAIGGLSVSSAVIAVSSSFDSVALMLAVAYATGFLWNVITISLRQRIVPDHLLGRVNSAYRLLAFGGLPLGSLLGGLLVVAGTAVANREVGLRTPFMVSGALNATLLVLALPRLTTARIEAARREAGGQSDVGQE